VKKSTLARAVILAAGRGTRMQELTERRPKPMIEIRGRPILARLVNNLREADLREIFIVTGYRAEQVEEYFAGHPGIRFRRQLAADGTARAALLARDFAGSESFLLSYGDILTGPVVYREVAARLEGAEAVVAVKRVEDPCQGAAVYVEDDRVTRIIEKPPKGTSTTNWNSAGIYCFRPSIFDHLAAVERSRRGEYELTSAVAALVAAGAPVRHYAIAGWWRDIGRPEDLVEAERVLPD